MPDLQPRGLSRQPPTSQGPPLLGAAQRGRGVKRPARGDLDGRLFLLRRTPIRTPLGAGCGMPRRRCCTPWCPCRRAATSPPFSSSTPPLYAEVTASCRGTVPARVIPGARGLAVPRAVHSVTAFPRVFVQGLVRGLVLAAVGMASAFFFFFFGSSIANSQWLDEKRCI